MIKNRIREILKDKGLTQNDLAKKMGTTQETVSRQINGNPTLKTLTEIAAALDVEVWELFTVSTDKKELYGFVEYKDEVIKILSLDDLENLLKKLKDNS